MIVKVCGMGDEKKMHELSMLNIDMLGFIFYPKSPRYVVGKIAPKAIASLPKGIRKVGVFVNADFETIKEAATKYHLDTIQLHGSETPDLCKQLKTEGFAVIKAFNLTRNNNFEAYDPYCSWYVFDTPSEQHGGTGQKFDWSLLHRYNGKTPFLLSGGIGPGDVKELELIHHPMMAGIDINSKFEVKPGIKNTESIKQFLSNIE